jgi:hypothetical protein
MTCARLTDVRKLLKKINIPSQRDRFARKSGRALASQGDSGAFGVGYVVGRGAPTPNWTISTDPPLPWKPIEIGVGARTRLADLRRSRRSFSVACVHADLRRDGSLHGGARAIKTSIYLGSLFNSGEIAVRFEPVIRLTSQFAGNGRVFAQSCVRCSKGWASLCNATGIQVARVLAQSPPPMVDSDRHLPESQISIRVNI